MMILFKILPEFLPPVNLFAILNEPVILLYLNLHNSVLKILNYLTDKSYSISVVISSLISI